MNSSPAQLYGLMAEFDTADALVAAARRVADAGYSLADAYSPFPIEGLAEALRLPPSRIPYAMLAGGVGGAVLGYAMQCYATVVAYPLNIGGHALPSWPGFVPVTVEVTILGAVVSGIAALSFATRLPRLYHPVFNHPDFRRASQDGFFLCLRAKDDTFDYASAERLLNELEPMNVRPVHK